MIPLSDPDEVAQGKAAIDAAQHVPHVVCTSATNADRGTGIPHFDTKRRSSGTWPLIIHTGQCWARPRSCPPTLGLHVIALEDIAATEALAFEQPARSATAASTSRATS